MGKSKLKLEQGASVKIDIPIKVTLKANVRVSHIGKANEQFGNEDKNYSDSVECVDIEIDYDEEAFRSGVTPQILDSIQQIIGQELKDLTTGGWSLMGVICSIDFIK